jgi:peptidyl-prolyl cis-trans isomerase SurA
MDMDMNRFVSTFGKTILRNDFIVSVVLLLLLMVAVSSGVHGAEYVDRIVAVVNDDIITLSELNELLKPYITQIQAGHYPAQQERKMMFSIREKVMDELIRQKLTDQEIKKANITVSESEIDSTIERIKEAQLFTDEELRAALRQRGGMSMEEYKRQIKSQILRTKIINLQVKSKIVITQEDIAAYYKSHTEIYAGEKKYHLRNIMLKQPLLPDKRAIDAVYQKMETIIEKIKDGESFEQMAMKYSESPLAADGGDLGSFEWKALSPKIQEAIKGLGPGECTDVLETDQGYQLFYIDEIITAPGKSLEEVSEDIREKLFTEIVDRKFRTWVEGLRQKSYIRMIK